MIIIIILVMKGFLNSISLELISYVRASGSSFIVYFRPVIGLDFMKTKTFPFSRLHVFRLLLPPVGWYLRSSRSRCNPDRNRNERQNRRAGEVPEAVLQSARAVLSWAGLEHVRNAQPWWTQTWEVRASASPSPLDVFLSSTFFEELSFSVF